MTDGMRVRNELVRTEEINEAIRRHEHEVTDWGFRDIAVRLNCLFDQLNVAFFGGRLPKAVIAVGPDLIVRYGYYRIGRDEIGAKDRIQLNSRHFGRSESDVAVTLLHEMLHLYQHQFGKPGRRARRHNREFVDLAEAVGIIAEIESGRTQAVTTALRVRLAALGFHEDCSMVDGTVAVPVRRPERKQMWVCDCRQRVWVPQGETAHIQCNICRAHFRRVPRSQEAAARSRGGAPEPRRGQPTLAEFSQSPRLQSAA